MGYTWTDGELITATKLNNTGGGNIIISANDIGDYSYSQILGYVEAGNIVVAIFDDRDQYGVGDYTLYYLINCSYDGENLYSCYFSNADGFVNLAISSTEDGALTWDSLD